SLATIFTGRTTIKIDHAKHQHEHEREHDSHFDYGAALIVHEMIQEHCAPSPEFDGALPTQDRRRLSRYMRRWLVASAQPALRRGHDQPPKAGNRLPPGDCQKVLEHGGTSSPRIGR